jgi:hypothetical protein
MEFRHVLAYFGGRRRADAAPKLLQERTNG